MYGSAQRSEILICTLCRASYRDPNLTTCPRDGASLTVWADDPMIGQVVGGRYQIVEPIGQGGMGSVYLAERIPDELEVAVKIVRSEHLRNATVHERFLREVKHTRSINSPHVVKILDSGMSEDERAFMVMEYLQGESLTERLRRPPALSAYEALHVARDVGRALAAAHAAEVIHRDLKPDNIFLCSDGRVVVVDFGIAKAYDHKDKTRPSEPSLTEAHRVVGTPVYMAPEVITKSGLYPSSDLYALGVILYEMLIGEPPFFEKDAIGTMYRHLHEQPKRVREVDERLNIPGALETLIRDLLTKKAKERPSNATEIVARIDALRRIVEENQRRAPMISNDTGDLTKVWSPGDRDSIPDVPEKQPKRRRRSRGRRWGMLALAALLALSLGFAATAGVIYFLRAGRDTTVQLPER